MAGFRSDVPTLIKMDCEGGERSLLGDSESAALLANALQASVEFHYGTHSPGLPEWQVYADWISEIETMYPDRHYECEVLEESQTAYWFSRGAVDPVIQYDDQGS